MLRIHPPMARGSRAFRWGRVLQVVLWPAMAASLAFSCVPRRAGAGTVTTSRSWRQVHEEAKGLEQRLKAAMLESSQRVRELDAMFLDEPTKPKKRQKTPAELQEEKKAREVEKELDPLGWGRMLKARAPEPLFPDVEANPPILAGEFANEEPIVGMYSSSPSCSIPARVYREDLLQSARDDPSASKEENELWQNAVELLTQTLEPMWPEAEERVMALVTAEYKAEQRRDAKLGQVRKRVLQMMVKANTGLRSEEELDRLLTILQTDERLLKYLGLLEKCCFEAEKIQGRMDKRQQQFRKSREASYAQERAEEAVVDVFARAQGLELRIQACCSAAEELPETYDSMDDMGDFFNNLNPFR
ncbi:CPK15 [Symbiodinium natans]|uniref:CPK15 protein n=1 Tax=Symbiodinium natans TaxID=878477 RepID=A0A812QR05_9DINO|nr:CPK15 [Symbiodinium natans]